LVVIWLLRNLIVNWLLLSWTRIHISLLLRWILQIVFAGLVIFKLLLQNINLSKSISFSLNSFISIKFPLINHIFIFVLVIVMLLVRVLQLFSWWNWR
jgi:hypothetical protein